MYVVEELCSSYRHRPFPSWEPGTSTRRRPNTLAQIKAKNAFARSLFYFYVHCYLRVIDVVESSTALLRCTGVVPDSAVVPVSSFGSVARVHQANLPALYLRSWLIQKFSLRVEGLIINEPKAPLPLISTRVRMTSLCARCILGNVVCVYEMTINRTKTDSTDRDNCFYFFITICINL